VVVLVSLARNIAYLDHDNRAQLTVVRAAEALLGPGGTYFDGIGMLPNHFDTPRRWLDLPGIAKVTTGRDDLIAALQETPPDLIIETTRTDRLPKAFAAWVSARYVSAAPGLLVPGAALSPGETVFLTVERPTRFRVYSGGPAPDIAIDGRRRALPVSLAPGTYLIAWPDGAASARLMPDGLDLPDRPVARQPLFEGVYTR